MIISYIVIDCGYCHCDSRIFVPECLNEKLPSRKVNPKKLIQDSVVTEANVPT